VADRRDKMMSDDWTYEDLVIASAGSEWPESPPKGLLSYSFSVDREAKEVWLTASFDGPIGDDDQDEMLAIEGAVGGQLPDDWQANTRIVLRGDSESALSDQSITIFERGTAVNPKALRVAVLNRHGR
jgi:hypothetical protein